MTQTPKQAPQAKKKGGPKRRPAQRARAAGHRPQSNEEVAQGLARALELLMRHGVKACLKEKIPSAVVFMAATEQVGLLGSMLGLPYPQTLQAACNGVESVYRSVAPEQVRADRPIEQMAQAMAQKAPEPASVDENGSKVVRTREE